VAVQPAQRPVHVGFIEEWWLVNPAAFIGIALGAWKAKTRMPPALQRLGQHRRRRSSTSPWPWACSLYRGRPRRPRLFLFLSVWLPCCTSDIVFPLLFAPNKDAVAGCGCGHDHHHHH
jgi:hypothetical protein